MALLTVLAGCSGDDDDDADAPDGGSGDGDADGDADGGGPGEVFCGNGLVDGDEQCERLDGCEDAERCTAECTCEARASAPPTSQDLIAQALEDGTIDYATSLQYRVWALYQAPDLPEAYDGEGSSGEDTELFLELSRVRALLPAEVEEEIAPYLARPDNPASIYSQPPFFERGNDPGPPPVGCPRDGQPRPNLPDGLPDWRATQSEHFVVWSCGGGVNGTDRYGAARDVASGIAEQIWARMSPVVGSPKPDIDGIGAGVAPINRPDIYLLEPNQARMRNGRQEVISGDTLAAAVMDLPCDADPGPALSSSGYLIVPAAAVPAAVPPAGTASEFRNTLAHEYFHLIEYKRSIEAIGGACTPILNLGPPERRAWQLEASAEWAAHSFFREDEPARRTLFLQAFQGRDPARVGLHSVFGYEGYEAYLYPWFIQREGDDSRDLVAQHWNGAGAVRTIQALDDRLDTLFDFGEHFRDFTFLNFNRRLPGDPISRSWQDFDGALPFAQEPYLSEVLEPALRIHAPNESFPVPLRIPPLSMQTEHYVPDDTVRSFRVDAGPVSATDLYLDVITKIGGVWKRERVPGRTYTFCRDIDGQNVEELYVIYTNAAHDRAARIEGDAVITARTRCYGGWQGFIRIVESTEEHGVDAQPAGTTTTDNLDVDTQEWTVIGTRMAEVPGVPGYEVETIDTTWHGSLVVGRQTIFEGPDCRLTHTEVGSGSATAQTPFTVTDLGDQSFTLSSPNPQVNYDIVVEESNDVVGEGFTCGESGQSTRPQTSTEAWAYFFIFPELMRLQSDNPEDAGTFRGTANQHDEYPVAGGSVVSDITATWNLQRFPLAE